MNSILNISRRPASQAFAFSFETKLEAKRTRNLIKALNIATNIDFFALSPLLQLPLKMIHLHPYIRHQLRTMYIISLCFMRERQRETKAVSSRHAILTKMVKSNYFWLFFALQQNSQSKHFHLILNSE
jgi:hypothetical protein